MIEVYKRLKRMFCVIIQLFVLVEETKARKKDEKLITKIQYLWKVFQVCIQYWTNPGLQKYRQLCRKCVVGIGRFLILALWLNFTRIIFKKDPTYSLRSHSRHQPFWLIIHTLNVNPQFLSLVFNRTLQTWYSIV